MGARPWSEVLGSIAELLRAHSTHLLGIHSQTGDIQFSHEGGTTAAHFTLEYLKTWHRLDPRIAPTFAIPPGHWMHCHELFDDEYIARDPFYSDFLIPHGVRYLSATHFVTTPELRVVFSASRAVGSLPLDEGDRETLQRLGAHLESALSLRTKATAAMQMAFIGYPVLRKLNYPLQVLSNDRTVVFSNDAAQSLISEGAILVSDGRLALRDRIENAAFTLGMKQAQLAKRPMSASSDSQRMTSLVRCGRSLRNKAALIHLSHIELSGSMDSLSLASAIVVTYFTGKESASLDPFVVGYAYGLTPAESRVAVGVAQGQTVESLANKNGTSVATVRTQLKHACAKIGVNRQVELTRLLGSNPVFQVGGPIGGDIDNR